MAAALRCGSSAAEEESLLTPVVEGGQRVVRSLMRPLGPTICVTEVCNDIAEKGRQGLTVSAGNRTRLRLLAEAQLMGRRVFSLEVSEEILSSLPRKGWKRG